MKIMTRKLMNIHQAIHPRDDIERLYGQRKGVYCYLPIIGGRIVGFMSFPDVLVL